MPKKTRKTKILAEQRKKLKLSRPDLTIEKTAPAPLKESPVNESYALTNEEISMKKYFIHDFKRSLIIIVLIFSLEILLYFASMSNYISKLFKF